jgi:predicted amidohydrolase YtcJ
MKTRYFHARFYTMIDATDFVSELWTEAGIIIHLGPHPSWKADRQIDLNGWIGFPGFVDAHLHLLGYGEKLSLLQLNQSQDRDWIIMQLRNQPQQDWLYAQGHREQFQLTKRELDMYFPHTAVILRHADFHGATVNSLLLNRIGLSTHPTGILHEAEAMKAIQALPKYKIEQLVDMLKTAYRKLYQYGVTGGHSDDLYYFNGFHDTVTAFETVLQTHPFRTHLLMHHEVLTDFINSKRPWLNQSPYLQLGAIKIFYDGTISSQTALMANPYQGSDRYGERQFSLAVWEEKLKRIRQAGLPVAIHTIGDQALEEVASWLKRYPVKSGLHDRIIHASFALPETVVKLKALPLIFDIQPQFLTSDLPWALEVISNKTAYIYPWKTYQNQGLILCGSSDAPVEIPDPLLGIAAAYDRRVQEKIYQPEERLTMFEAVQLYTSLANVPTYESHRRGYLKMNHLADFTFVDQDFLNEPHRLSHTKVMMTVIDDKIVYKN